MLQNIAETTANLLLTSSNWQQYFLGISPFIRNCLLYLFQANRHVSIPIGVLFTGAYLSCALKNATVRCQANLAAVSSYLGVVSL